MRPHWPASRARPSVVLLALGEKTRAGPGTMAALALSYFGSPQFNALRSSSQYVYRRTIERFGKDHGDSGRQI
jgi:hypothetical protein